jgi:ADP-ribose pyrophosphatase YjhB (NUDIX family)
MALLEGWRFCPRCGSGAEHRSNHLRCRACSYIVWAGSAVGVVALVVEGDRILLARRAAQPGTGLWDTLGGFVEEGEHPVDAVRRELHEETGMTADNVEQLAIAMDHYEERSLLTIQFVAYAQGTPCAADDVAELRWFGADDLPAREDFAFQNA